MNATNTQPKISRWWRIGAYLIELFSPFKAGLLLCVALPTFLTVAYYGFLASDIYVSESSFSVRVDKGSSPIPTETSFLPSLLNGNVASDQLVVNSFVTSRGAVDALTKELDLKALYASSQADMLARLPSPVTSEKMLDYYQDMVTLQYDDPAQITSLKVRAFNAKDAQTINVALLAQAEQFVNTLSSRMREDSLSFARQQMELAESELIDANKALAAFRAEHGSFDPAITTKSAVTLVEGMREKLAEARVQRDTQREIMTEENPQLKALNRMIAVLEEQISQEQSALVSNEPSTINSQLEAYNSLALNYEFANKRYGLSLAALEAAQAEAGKKQIYLLRVVSPTLPQEALEPRRIHRIFSVFFLSLAAYVMALLIAASVADHIRR